MLSFFKNSFFLKRNTAKFTKVKNQLSFNGCLPPLPRSLTAVTAMSKLVFGSQIANFDNSL